MRYAYTCAIRWRVDVAATIAYDADAATRRR